MAYNVIIILRGVFFCLAQMSEIIGGQWWGRVFIA